MPLLQMALIVTARRELTLRAGETRRGGPEGETFELASETVDTVEGPASLKFGVAQTGSVYLTGAEVVNIDYPEDSLSLAWYLPAEENPEDARPVELAKVGLIPTILERESPEDPDGVWYFQVDARGPFTETLFFDSGFLPPFKASDLTLYLTDLGNYGYKTMVLSKVFYGHKAPTYTEGDWMIPETIARGVLEN
ncbi:MAG: hypothetical protein LBO66_10950 [Deltaproteobacteria bacterium]|jgi:hypothetical protein|nr:hypothetical protein [Deltaproteobacteria bacterium]